MTTITQFKDNIILYGGVEVSDIGENTNAFLSWVSQALVNRHEEVCHMSNKWAKTTGTAAGTFEMDLPSDWDYFADSIEIYTDSDYQNEIVNWDVQYGVIRFNSKKGSETYYIRYRKASTVYTSMTDEFVEISNPRLNKVLMDAVIALFLQSEEDFELGSAGTNALSNADANS